MNTQKKLNITDYINQVNQDWSGINAYGAEQGSQESMYFDGRRPAPMIPAQMQNLPDSDPFEIQVVNSTGGTLTAVLFGRNKYSQSTNYGSAVGLVVTTGFSDVSYLQLLEESASQPFETSRLRISCSNTTQVTKVLSIKTSNSRGDSHTKSLSPNSYYSEMQNLGTIVTINKTIVIDSNTWIEADILAGATVIYTFFPREMVSTTRALSAINEAPLKQFAPAPQLIGMVPTY